MTKKKKVVLFTCIGTGVILIGFLIYFFFIPKSVKGTWLIDAHSNMPFSVFNYSVYDYDSLSDEVKEKFDNSRPYEIIFEDDTFTVNNKSGKEISKYYYKIDKDKLYYSSDLTELNEKYYIITKRTSNEFRFKGTSVDAKETILKR